MKKITNILAGIILALVALPVWAGDASPQPVITVGEGLISDGVNLIGPTSASINWTISATPQTYILEIAEINAQGGVIASRTPAVFSPSSAGSMSESFPINFGTDSFFQAAGAGGFRVKLTAFFPDQEPTPAVFVFSINAPSPTLGVTPITVEGETNAGFEFNMNSGISGVPQYRYTITATNAATRGEKGADQQFVFGPMAADASIETITKAELAPGSYNFTLTVETAIGGNPANQAFGSTDPIGPFRLNAAPSSSVYDAIAPVINIDTTTNDVTRTFTITAFDDVAQAMTANIDLVRAGGGGQVDATLPPIALISGQPQSFDVTFTSSGIAYELNATITDSDNALLANVVSSSFVVNDVPSMIQIVSSDLVAGLPAFDATGAGPYAIDLIVQAKDDLAGMLGVTLAYPGVSEFVGNITPPGAGQLDTLAVPGFNVAAGAGVVDLEITVEDANGNSTTVPAPILINREPFNLNLAVNSPNPTDIVNADTQLIPVTLPFNLEFIASDNSLPGGADTSLDFLVTALDGINSPTTLIETTNVPGVTHVENVSPLQAGIVYDSQLTVTDFRNLSASVAGPKFRINAPPVPAFLDAIFEVPGTPVIQAEYLAGTLNRATGVAQYRTSYSVSAVDEVGAPATLAITAIVDATSTLTATSSVPAVANNTPANIDFDFALTFDTGVTRNRTLLLEAIDSETTIIDLAGSTSREVLVNGQPIIEFTRIEFFDLLNRNGDIATVEILIGFIVRDDASGRNPLRDEKGLESDLIVDVTNTLNDTAVVTDYPVNHDDEVLLSVVYDVDTSTAGPTGNNELSVMVTATDADGGESSESRSFLYKFINSANNWSVYE